MNIPSFHHASLPILEGRAFMLRFSPMEWWFWNARTGFWISLRQTQMQTQERMNSQFKTWILLWNGELFKKNEKEEFPLHFTPFAPQFPSNVQSQSQNSWPSLPDEAYLPEPQESQDFLKDGPIFSYSLHRTFSNLSIPTAGAVPCKGKRLPSRRRRAWDFPSGGKRALTSAVQYWTPMEMIGNEPWPNQTKSRGVF